MDTPTYIHITQIHIHVHIHIHALVKAHITHPIYCVYMIPVHAESVWLRALLPHGGSKAATVNCHEDLVPNTPDSCDDGRLPTTTPRYG